MNTYNTIKIHRIYATCVDAEASIADSAYNVPVQ